MRMLCRTVTRTLGALALAGVAMGGAAAKEAGVAAAVNADSLTKPPLEDERTLVVGHNVVFDERITTGERGQAQLLMLDQSALTVAPNSELVIDKFVYDPEKKTGEMAMSLSRGLMRFVGGRLSKTGGVTVRTPAATMGIRGGIALVHVISPTVVDVTLLYGDAITGVTDTGRPFSLRRHGYFTRIENQKGAAPPQPASAAVIAQAITQMQGRAEATAGALTKPTVEAVAQAIGLGPPPVNEAVVLVNTAKPTAKAPLQAGLEAAGLLPENGGDGPGDRPPPLPEDIPSDEALEQIFDIVLLELSAAKQGDRTFDAGVQRIEVIDSEENAVVADALVSIVQDSTSNLGAGDFGPGDQFFRVSGVDGELIAFINGLPLAFFEPGVDDPNNVRNIFDASDATSFASPTAYNAAISATAGAGAATVFEAQNISGELFFNYDLTSPDFTATTGARQTIVGGTGLFQAPNGRSFFEANGDSQSFSFLPYSEIGLAQLPANGGVVGAQPFAAANVAETPVIVDWNSGKAIYTGGVFQNLRGDGNTSGVMAYGIQAYVGNVTKRAGEPISLLGSNAGSTHIARGANEQRLFHGGGSLGGPLGSVGTGLALSLDGGHETLTHTNAADQREDPTFTANHQFGAEIAPIALAGSGTGVANEALFLGTILAEEDGNLAVIATDPDGVEGVGVLRVNRTNKQLTATVRIDDRQNPSAPGDALIAPTNPASSAFINNDLFAIADAREELGGLSGSAEPSFVLVSGESVLPDRFDACTCAFMHWGLWAGAVNEPQEAANPITDIGAFFAGVPTVDMPISGSGSYVGQAYASMITPSDASPAFAAGDFTLQVQFATGQSAGQMNLDAETFAVVGSHTPGAPRLSLQYLQNAQNVGVGNGSYFGPNAANLGATIDIDNGLGLKAGGAVVAERQ